MGYTMRFPRALSIRDDLSIADCMAASGMSLFIKFFGRNLKTLSSCNGQFAHGKKKKDGKRRRVRFNQFQILQFWTYQGNKCYKEKT